MSEAMVLVLLHIPIPSLSGNSVLHTHLLEPMAMVIRLTACSKGYRTKVHMKHLHACQVRFWLYRRINHLLEYFGYEVFES